ncbi:MAG: transcriptional repressor LexA [Planctomycetes bacterium]|nr:transcriptional repressor LexA [Planctomycetota bacterium]
MNLQTAKPTNQFTPRQLQLLKAITAFKASRCYSPTIAELACEMGISRSTAFEHITELRRKGLLSSSPAKARSLKPTSKAQKLLSSLADYDANFPAESSAGIPLVGRVAAGLPIEAIENSDRLSINSHFATGDNVFALEVTGDSMTGDGICDGDYVICRKSSVANNGQLVVAIVDNDNATVKRFYKEKDKVRLQPSNDDYEPIYSDNCRIEALVLGLVRKF